MIQRLICFAAACGLMLAAAPARADPCKAIPDHGPAPSYLHAGAQFSGPVVRVLDGDSLCVSLGGGPDRWVEVRLADFYAPELGQAQGPRARAALRRVALGRRAECEAGRQSYDRIVATCRIGGQSIGELLRAGGAEEGGRGYPAAQEPTSRHWATMRPVIGTEHSDSQAFRSCAAARAAGAAPLHRGEPGYSERLDGDHDGVACEPYRRR